ncbi:MAG: AGE family epimerase/isomerase [Nocardioides sp.]|nr:AGE family epimerase/isomerase [Nocardioides sp.]
MGEDRVVTASAISAAAAKWLEDEGARLLAFGRGAVHPDGGFGWLDDSGRLDPDRPVETWITTRMTHCYALASLRGADRADELVDHGVRALLGGLRDDVHGGWRSATAGPGAEIKEAYAHAFVVLAATSAYAAGHPDAEPLLEEALEVVERRFWRERDAMVVDVFPADWSAADPYRGVNANMHSVEAFLAVAEVTGERVWLTRALAILDRVVHGFAREHDWRLPEHYDESWHVLLDYNRDQPRDRFRPYGVTIGHLFEWARLALHARTSLLGLGEGAPTWLLDDARRLVAAAAERGWAVDGAQGLVYTTDFADRPVVRERMHWVLAEAVSAALALYRETDEAWAAERVRTWWRYADDHLIDREHGSWHHELDAENRPSATVWPGKPDIYHAYQAALLPLLPRAGSFAGAVLKART